MTAYNNFRHPFPKIALAFVIFLSLACGSTLSPTSISPVTITVPPNKTSEGTTQTGPIKTSTTVPSPTISLTLRSSATPKPPPIPLPIGSRLNVADWEYSISSGKVMNIIGDEKARGAFVVALVDVTNLASQQRELGSDIFMATDAQGRVYEFSGDASLAYYQTYHTSSWFLGDISASSQVSIPLVFDVSPDATQISLLASRTDNPALLIAEAAGGQALTLEGQVYNYSGWAYGLVDTATANTIGDYTARGKYVIAVIKVQNLSLTPRELGSDLFQAKDSEGRIYSMNSDASLAYYQSYKTDAWFLEVLNPSLVGKIPVVFDVSPDATQVTLFDRADNNNLLIDAMGGQALTLVGEIHQARNWQFVIKEVKTASTIGDKLPNGKYVILVLKVKNLDTVAQEFGGGFLSLKDSTGHIYEFDSEASLEYYQQYKTDAWHLESIGPSLMGSIPIVFDVTSGATGFVLTGAEVDIPLTVAVP